MKKILFIFVLTFTSLSVLAQSRTTKSETNRKETTRREASRREASRREASRREASRRESSRDTDVLEDRNGHGSFASETFEFQYLLFGGDVKDYYKDFNMGISVASLGYRYFINNVFFIEGFVGYRGYWYSTVYKYTTTVHNITLPIHVGGHLNITEKFGIRPFFGPRIDFPVSSKIEYGGNSTNANVKTGVSLEFGLDFQFKNWGIRAKYGMGVGDYKNMNYVSIGGVVGI